MKKIIAIFLFLILFLVPIFVLAEGSGSSVLDGMLERIKTAVLYVGTAIVIIGWVIAGGIYLFANGDPQKIETGKKAFIACVIGTLLIALARSGEIVALIKNAFGITGQ